MEVDEKELKNLEKGLVDIDQIDDTLILSEPTTQILQLGNEMSKSKNLPYTNCMVLLGVSGCSKTRTIYDVFSLKFGLYFTANGGGSRDLKYLISHLTERLNLIVDPKEKENIGNFYVNALLYVRLLVFHQFLLLSKNHKIDSKLLPYYWLLLQLKRDKLLISDEELFISLFKLALQMDPHYLKMLVENLLGESYIIHTNLFNFSNYTWFDWLQFICFN